MVFDMITYNGAINALIPSYGMENGDTASLVVLDAPTPEECILSKAQVLHYFKNGKEVSL
jgi:cytosine/adenosine deaminase-related metal-dependent hydrolase